MLTIILLRIGISVTFKKLFSSIYFIVNFSLLEQIYIRFTIRKINSTLK